MKIPILQIALTAPVNGRRAHGGMAGPRRVQPGQVPGDRQARALHHRQAIAIHGVWSSYELGLGTKLSMWMTLDWWNFEESVAGFFIHCIAVAGLAISTTYYGLKLLQRAKSARGPARVAAGAEPAHA